MFDNFRAMVESPPKGGNKGKPPKQEHYGHQPATPGCVNGAVQIDGHTDTHLSSVQSALKDSGGIEECFDSFLFEET